MSESAVPSSYVVRCNQSIESSIPVRKYPLEAPKQVPRETIQKADLGVEWQELQIILRELQTIRR